MSALLAALVLGSLHAAVPDAEPAALAQAAASLATGDVAHAAARLPQVAHATLLAAYHTAFGRLLDGLTVVTLLNALAVFAFLSRVRAQDEPVTAQPGAAHTLNT